MLTLSKVAVLVVEGEPLVTAKPTNTGSVSNDNVALPTEVHVVPSADLYVVNVRPLRMIRTQHDFPVVELVVVLVVPLDDARLLNASTLDCSWNNSDASIEPDDVLCRTISPAAALAAVPLKLATRAVIVKSPVNDVYRKRNPSAVPVMPAPRAFTVYVPDL